MQPKANNGSKGSRKKGLSKNFKNKNQIEKYGEIQFRFNIEIFPPLFFLFHFSF